MLVQSVFVPNTVKRFKLVLMMVVALCDHREFSIVGAWHFAAGISLEMCVNVY